MATVTDQPDNTETCDDDNETTGNASFSATVAGGTREIRWQRSTNGSTWVDITGTATPNDNCSYSNYYTASSSGTATSTLNISSADIGIDGYQYRVKLTTTTGGCETFSDPAILTVHPVPSLTDPGDPDVCEGDPFNMSSVVTISTGSIQTLRWRRFNGSSWSYVDGPTNPNDGVIYSGTGTNTLTIDAAINGLDNYRYRLYATSNQGCIKRSPDANINVNPLADITAHPGNADICANENTSFTVTTDGNPAVTSYRWQRSDGGAFVNIGGGLDGGIYTNFDQATLTVTAAPQTVDGYQYRCEIFTNGPAALYQTTPP
jgi:hypothetical protein